MKKKTFDFSDIFGKLDHLEEKMHTSIARSMSVAGGKVIRDEAKLRVGQKTGKLRDAIYLAYQDAYSTPTKVLYRISWNRQKAPHGHLIEFGHWRKNRIFRDLDGEIRGKKKRLTNPRWVPAHPFLRPAFEASRNQLFQVMCQRGRERLQEIASDMHTGNTDAD